MKASSDHTPDCVVIGFSAPVPRRTTGTSIDLETAVLRVEKALSRNRNCSMGIFGDCRVFGVPCGPSGGSEILAYLYVDDPFFGYWYGHLLPHPRDEGRFVSLVVRSDKLVNADNLPLLFQRFHYWIKTRLEYHPVAVQETDDAYSEASSLESAAEGLARMAERFTLERRSGDEDGPFAISPPELRIFDIYGLSETQDEHGCYPPFPMAKPLVSVGNQA